MFIATLNLLLSSTLLFVADGVVVETIDDGVGGRTMLFETAADDASNKMSSKLGTLTFCKNIKIITGII